MLDEPPMAAEGVDRVVHRFDFDERPSGNLEALPKHWRPFRTEGFPRFAQGRFDAEVGRSAPPSFYLAGDGRDVAYEYAGPQTPVRASSDYQIEGYLRADRLTHARACLSACFLTENGEPLRDTLVRSRYVGGHAEPDGWAKVEFHLSSAPADARTIGITAWVLQEQFWQAGPIPRRHISRTDVHGGAWFDDITIRAWPRVELASSSAGHVLQPGMPQELLITLADYSDAGLEGRLRITDADQTAVERHSIPVMVGETVPPVRIPVDHLQPGLYTARLDVVAGESVIGSRQLSFARVQPLYRGIASGARAFGMVVDPQWRANPAAELALLKAAAIRSVKLPAWTGLPDHPPTTQEARARDRFLEDLLKCGFALTGVFYGPPSAIVRRDGVNPRSLRDLLNGPPEEWRDELARVVAPYAGVFQWWQIGPDGRAESRRHEGTKAHRDEGIEALQAEIRRYVPVPHLAAPLSVDVEPAKPSLPVEQLALALGADLPPTWFAESIRRFMAPEYTDLTAFVEPLPAGQYHRIPRLADYAQRILSARHAGADTVFVPQTWSVREGTSAYAAEPTEELLILRTIADVLSDSVPGQRVVIAPGVQCLAFHESDTTILALWDGRAGPGGRRHAIQLGAARRQIDLWGGSQPLEHDEHGQQVVHLSPMPILIDGVDRWLIELRTGVTIRPDRVESGLEIVSHRVEVDYRGSRQVSGQGSLEAPASWKVSPRNFPIHLGPGQTADIPIEIRYPNNEPAGRKDLVLKLELEGQYLEVPLWVEVGLAAVEVRGMAFVEGSHLLLRHVVTNRSEGPLSFRGSANVPGRERRYRPVTNLMPGRTQMLEYRFEGGSDLIGAKVHLGLRPLGDGTQTHNLEITVP